MFVKKKLSYQNPFLRNRNSFSIDAQILLHNGKILKLLINVVVTSTLFMALLIFEVQRYNIFLVIPNLSCKMICFF